VSASGFHENRLSGIAGRAVAIVCRGDRPKGEFVIPVLALGTGVGIIGLIVIILIVILILRVI
jgi:hypothetical protein